MELKVYFIIRKDFDLFIFLYSAIRRNFVVKFSIAEDNDNFN
jgi:hypothetical protein